MWFHPFRSRISPRFLRILKTVSIIQAVVAGIATVVLWIVIGTSMPCVRAADCAGERQLAQVFVLIVGGAICLEALIELWILRDEEF